MRNEKAQQRDQLIREFGILMQPFEELAKRNVPPVLHDYRLAIAKVLAGDNAWRGAAKQFATFAHDVVFMSEWSDIAHVPERLRRDVQSRMPTLANDPAQLQLETKMMLQNATDRFFHLLDSIPVGWEPVLFEANTPFTSYLRVREALAVVNTRLYYFDRYLHEDFFPLFLRTVPRTVEVRLVTTKGDATYGVRHVTPVSDLARQEFKNYQLVQVNAADIHDRNLWVDDQNFTLGPGTARAGFALTNFGPADSSPKARQDLEAVIGRGLVVHQS